MWYHREAGHLTRYLTTLRYDASLTRSSCLLLAVYGSPSPDECVCALSVIPGLCAAFSKICALCNVHQQL